jgi:hypothetical protein
MNHLLKPIDEDAEPMPDYSDEEIDKTSDDISELDDITIDGKVVKSSRQMHDVNIT